MDNIIDLPIKVTFNEAKQILSKLKKLICEDYAFGDAEMAWVDEDGNYIASGYSSYNNVSVWFDGNRQLEPCTDQQLYELSNCYLTITRSRNDSLDSNGE